MKSQVQSSRGKLRLIQLDLRLRIRRVRHDRNGRQSGNDFLQQFEPFPAQLRCNYAESRDIPAGSGKTFNETDGHRITDDSDDDWYRSRRVLERLRGGRS